MASRIDDYAMIGDGRTAALVSRDGSIDWLCLPRFDSDACCAALLGTEQHGYWRLAPCGSVTSRRSYRGDTLVLETEFTGSSGSVRLTDFMAIGAAQPTVVRQLTGLHGTLRLRCDLALSFDYGLMPPLISRRHDSLLAVVGPDLVRVRSPVPWQQSDHGMTAEFDVAAGRKLSFVLSYGFSYCAAPPEIDTEQALADTLGFWQNWASGFQREIPWREPAMRSLLTLKGLTHHRTGGMLAAATTSLPEQPEGSSNWDYRYCWLRDATFAVAALLNAGYHHEAAAWRDWVLRAVANQPDKMRIMYRVDGSRRLEEWTADWLPGYQGARPVRIGNAAAAQRQTEVPGELVDALDLIARAGLPDTPETLALERSLIGQLEAVWDQIGHGLWESRDQLQRYTYSAVMSWVGLDRFLRRRALHGDLDDHALDRLRALQTRIRADIDERGWHKSRGHFVDRYGGEHVDATLLLLPLVNFLPADDPRMSSTIDVIERELSEDGLVWRTRRGREKGEGAFIACSCWLANCRALQGRREEAIAILERVLSLRNDVGLLSEMYHPGLGCQVGNFPQALSHLALVNTALGLSGPVLRKRPVKTALQLRSLIGLNGAWPRLRMRLPQCQPRIVLDRIGLRSLASGGVPTRRSFAPGWWRNRWPLARGSVT